LKGAVRIEAEQKEDKKGDNKCVVVFFTQKSCEGNNKARRLGR
jgi:hypothetical protein